MFNGIFGKHDAKIPVVNEAVTNGTNPYCSSERRESYKRLMGPQPALPEHNGRRPAAAAPPLHSGPLSFEEIYESAAVKPPVLDYGIAKVAAMAASPHLDGMPMEFKRRALLMALDAADTSVGDVLNDVVLRQRALKEYEDALQEEMNHFDATQAERTRAEQQELDRITGQFMSRIQATLDETARAHEEFRAWQKSKQQELQRLTEAAALCVAQDKEAEEDDNKVTPIPQRATGTFR